LVPIISKVGWDASHGSRIYSGCTCGVPKAASIKHSLWVMLPKIDEINCRHRLVTTLTQLSGPVKVVYFKARIKLPSVKDRGQIDGLLRLLILTLIFDLDAMTSFQSQVSHCCDPYTSKKLRSKVGRPPTNQPRVKAKDRGMG